MYISKLTMLRKLPQPLHKVTNKNYSPYLLSRGLFKGIGICLSKVYTRQRSSSSSSSSSSSNSNFATAYFLVTTNYYKLPYIHCSLKKDRYAEGARTKDKYKFKCQIQTQIQTPELLPIINAQSGRAWSVLLSKALLQALHDRNVPFWHLAK